MLRRLIDLPGMAALEEAALMNPRYADADARDHFPELDACSKQNFGLTADEADEAPRPEGWDRIERAPLSRQVAAFEEAGWDVTHNRRPLRTLEHFNLQLWLALRGVAGRLPEPPAQSAPADEDAAKGWGSSLQAEASRYRRDRR